MDPVHFTGKEILEMAVRIEENGLRFYTDAGEASKSPELKEVFLFLASEEKNHIKAFTDLKQLVAEPGSEGYDPYFGEATLYLDAAADTEVFTNPDKGKELAAQLTDELEAVSYAIDMEKDSILFYCEIQKLIRDKDKAVLEQVIDQEKEHARKLTELQKRLSGR